MKTALTELEWDIITLYAVGYNAHQIASLVHRNHTTVLKNIQSLSKKLVTNKLAAHYTLHRRSRA